MTDMITQLNTFAAFDDQGQDESFFGKMLLCFAAMFEVICYLAGAVLLIALIVILLRGLVSMIFHGVMVDATVSDIQTDPRGGIRPVYTYSYEGKEYQGGNVSYPQCSLEIGQNVRLRINKKKPENIMYPRRDLVLCLIGIALLTIIIVFVLIAA